ncbi:MAG: hypothetical protein A4E28_02110 [Methanocella sp. PtaU1.Bin125]|nr:MAG: hypothetical protein A4E28_02110 [Methanocella sp. PtaU1.Bin125]
MDDASGKNDGNVADVDVEEIMRTIRENVRKKHNLPPENGEDRNSVPAHAISRRMREEIKGLERSQKAGDPEYVIESHRAIAGPLLIRGRKLVNGEVRRYVDPRFWRQQEFNLGIVRIADQLISYTDRRLNEMNKKLESMDHMPGEKRSWSEFYDMEVSEQFLADNVAFHREFVALVTEYSRKSAAGRVPRLLEVGLGTATLSIHFSRNAYECTGIDNDPKIVVKALETNRSLGGYARFMLMDALAMDLLKDGYFDVAFSQGTMEHFDNETLIRLLSLQLKAARYVAFSVPSPYWPDREFGNERKISAEEWRYLLESAGFNVLYLGYYHDKTQVACVLGPGGQAPRP